jgi:MFS family permease
MRALWILLAGQAMASMDSSILVVAAPSLRADLHADGAQLQLVVVIYTLVFAALVVTGARLGDVLGPRRAFLYGLTAFSLASLGGGLAPSAGALIGARAVQGAAGALMTPQVLSIIQRQYQGEQRARAIGAYSLILAVGVAAGQIAGGLLVSAHLLHGAWRPALLLDAPVGAMLLVAARTRLPDAPALPGRALDITGAAIFAVAMLALVIPLTLGREASWPWWTAPCLVGAAAAAAAFVSWERRVGDRPSGDPLFALTLLREPGVAAGAIAVLLIMGSYAGFLLSLTLHLQDWLDFSPLHAGLIFAVYATGFAGASLTWTRVPRTVRGRLPVAGPVMMICGVLAVGALAAGGDWPWLATIPALLLAGAGHAIGYSPLAHRLTASIAPTQVADLSGLLLTAGLLGSVLGVAGVSGVYLTAAAHDPGGALTSTTLVLAAALLLTAACAWTARIAATSAIASATASAAADA